MSVPLIATYRLQLNRDTPFARVRAALPYLQQLGISHVYCSPVLAARAGSTHGYDVVDPTRLNPELGTEDEWRALAGDIHERGMALVVDIVPNHMAASDQNPFWDDVLARGDASRWARWFDIDWGAANGRVVLPVLGDPLTDVLARGELREVERDGARRLAYFEHTFPVAEGSPRELEALLLAQHYRLSHWRRAATELNYRRFFDVNELVALRADDPAVFVETHAKVLEWVRDGIVDGLRVDHVDGIRDPQSYLEQLRAAVGPDCLIWVEKILLDNEKVRASWPVQGTTGYESIQPIEDALLDARGADRIERGYRRLRALTAEDTFARAVRQGKESVLRGALRPDLERVTRLLVDAMRASSPDRLPGRRALSGAIASVAACLRVYRTYVRADGEREPADQHQLRGALERARAFALARERELLQVERALQAGTPAAVQFTQAFQQLCAPAAAKGVEDTALYRWVPLASRNEIGVDPSRPLEDAVPFLHAQNAIYRPASLRAASTHDTKRTADARARIHALSEFADEWLRLVRLWRERHAPLRQAVPGLHRRTTPDVNAEYLLYQTLVALWDEPNAGTRAAEYMIKATREAKERTSWTARDDAFETGMRAFVRALLESEDGAAFRGEMASLLSRLAPRARALALAREVIRFTAPGVPDIYQGDERWNVALVDPDNRQRFSADEEAAGVASEKLGVVTRLLALRRRIPLEQAGYEPLRVVGEHRAAVIAFARISNPVVITIVARRQVADWRDTHVMLVPECLSPRWRCGLSDRLVSTEREMDEFGAAFIGIGSALADEFACVLVAEGT